MTDPRNAEAAFDSVEGEMQAWIAEYKRLIVKNDALFTRAVKAEAEVGRLREALRAALGDGE